ncbi:MAG: acyltransferase [Candidatus Parcubacteria bacterium]|nr:acyltransferase [Burkholderiales bacterium]
MGILRLLLAFSVFYAHAGFRSPAQIVPPDTAVHAFYLISGFYMAMVLHTRYGRDAYAEFLSNRALRLLPAYLLVAFATLALGFVLSAAIGRSLPVLEALRGAHDAGLPASAWPAFLLSQLTLLGLDLYQFFSWSSAAGFSPEADFRHDPAPLHRLLLVPQAWSVSIEIYFYLLAPWLTRLRLGGIAALIAGSLLLRYGMWALTDLRTDPWSYRFFPFELAYFLGGALAYRIAHWGWRSRLAALALPALALGFTDWWAQAHAGTPPISLARVAFIAVLLMGLSAIFDWSKDFRFDRYVGELSYPLYISHILVLDIVQLLAPTLNASRPGQLLIVVAALGVAVAIYEWIDRPIDRFRHSRPGMPLSPGKTGNAA